MSQNSMKTPVSPLRRGHVTDEPKPVLAPRRRRGAWCVSPLVAGIAALAGVTAHAAEVQSVTIKTLRAQMKYDVQEVEVRPGQRVKLTFLNEDDMPHNICFFQPGTDVIAVANKQIEKPDEALKRNWLPVDERMWLHSKPVEPKQSDHLEFTAPEKPGVYPFVCTFPGHAAIMNGRLIVAKPGPQIAGLKFALYLGNWDKLPNFAKLKPHREGDVPGNQVTLKLDDYKNEFGVVFTGTLQATTAGEYQFYLASDDGAALFVDGAKVVNNDNIHPASSIKEGKVKLKPGPHDFRLEYFQAAGGAEIYVAWKGPDFSMTPLSTWVHPNWNGGGKPKKKDESTGMPLMVGAEPVIYRNFIAAAGNRAIGVGYPGNANIAWSAESMNLALGWRGAFIDAARHWNSRGGGYQPPLGYDCFRPTELAPPFAVLANGATWPALGKGERAPGYTWLGYELDAKRHPIFRYEWQGVKVSDRFEVEGDALSGGRLLRTLKLEGAIPAGALFRVASGAKITPPAMEFLVDGGRFDGAIATDGKFVVSAEGATLNGMNLTLPARPEIKVRYAWPPGHGAHSAHDHGK